MEEGAEENYKKAGKIARSALERGAKKIKVGGSLLELAEWVEKEILSKADGLGFPANISRNKQAAHYSPGIGDDATFGEDVVKFDVGSHVNGYVGDTAMTVDLTGEHGKLVEATEQALENVLAAVKPGVNTSELGGIIEDTIRSYGFEPVENLGGHVLGKNVLHSGLSIPNVRTAGGWTLREGMAMAIEPFASAGRGRVTEESRVEILSVNSNEPTRNPDGRRVVAYANEHFPHFPFAKRHLLPAASGLKLKIALREIISKGIFTAYPVLVDDGLISQAERTIIVTKDGCDITTKV